MQKMVNKISTNIFALKINHIQRVPVLRKLLQPLLHQVFSCSYFGSLHCTAKLPDHTNYHHRSPNFYSFRNIISRIVLPEFIPFISPVFSYKSLFKILLLVLTLAPFSINVVTTVSFPLYTALITVRFKSFPSLFSSANTYSISITYNILLLIFENTPFLNITGSLLGIISHKYAQQSVFSTLN